jgi:hypothetical protein
MATSQTLALNINNSPPSDPLTSAQIFNYFLITLSVITGLVCIIQFMMKMNQKAKRSPLISYGLQSAVKNVALERNLVCDCTHNYKLHISGAAAAITAIFPKLKYSHLCQGLVFACLIRKCRTDLILPKQELNLMTSGAYKTYQVGFNSVPLWQETNNILWTKGFTNHITNIEVLTHGNCSRPWKTPTSLVYDIPIQILYFQFRMQVKFHIRHTSNPAFINFCT